MRHEVVEHVVCLWSYWRRCSCGWTVEDNNVRRLEEKFRRHVDASGR